MTWLHVNDKFANRYKLIRKLGSGGFADVWLAEDTLAGCAQIALKIFTPDKGLDDQAVEIFKNEYALTANLIHAHLLKAIYFNVHDGFPFLILPYCSLGSLDKLIDKGGSKPEQLIVAVMTQIASALAYLHTHNIVHQDIKPDNILILEEGRFMLSDFGISSKIRRILIKSLHAQSLTTQKAFTPGYTAPEWRNSRPIPKGDIFSLGITLYELITGYLPFHDPAMALEAGEMLPPLPESYSKVLYRVLSACTSVSPEHRPSAKELHEWGQSYINHSFWNASSLPPFLFGLQKDTSFSGEPPSRSEEDKASAKIRISSRGITATSAIEGSNKGTIQISSSKSTGSIDSSSGSAINPSTGSIKTSSIRKNTSLTAVVDKNFSPSNVIVPQKLHTKEKRSTSKYMIYLAILLLIGSLTLVFLYVKNYI